VTNLHEEIQEDDVFDAFSRFGEIKSLHLNLDRKTGYAKGYALIEYANFEEASEAINGMNGQELLEKHLTVDWAFQEKPLS
jgi:RNA-binding protein 8A